MSAGPGYTDAEGVYFFGEADEEALFSDLLNLLSTAVSAQLVLVRAGADTADGRLDDLEDATADTGWIDCTLKSGWSAVTDFTPQRRKIGPVVYLRGRAQSGSGACITLPAGWRPAQVMRLAGQTTTGAADSIRIDTNGDVTSSSSSYLSCSFVADA